MHSALDIVTANGRAMRFLFIPAGEAGPVPPRVPEGHPHAIAEVYDRATNDIGEHGRFTGAYYVAEELIDRYPGSPLAPRLGVRALEIDGAAMDIVEEWLRSLLSRPIGIAGAVAAG